MSIFVPHCDEHGAAETVGLASGFEDVGSIGDAIQQRLAEAGVGETEDHSENGRLVVMMTAAFSARSAMTWKSISAPTSARGT